MNDNTENLIEVLANLGFDPSESTTERETFEFSLIAPMTNGTVMFRAALSLDESLLSINAFDRSHCLIWQIKELDYNSVPLETTKSILLSLV